MTLAGPVFKDNKFLGVVAVDLTLKEVFVDVWSYRPNEISYAFIMDSNGS